MVILIVIKYGYLVVFYFSALSVFSSSWYENTLQELKSYL